MKRRDFIKCTGIIAALCGTHSLYSLSKGDIDNDTLWEKKKICLPNYLSDFYERCKKSGMDFYLCGGSVKSFMNGLSPKHIYLACRNGDSDMLMDELYALKVSPVPTFGLYKNIMKFYYNDILFVIEILDDSTIGGNITEASQNGSHPFAHAKLVYDLQKERVMGLTSSKGEFPFIELIVAPESDIERFAVYCAAHREAALFGFKLDDGIINLGDSVLSRDCSQTDSKLASLTFIGESDCILSLRGKDDTKRIIGSKYVRSAFKNWCDCDLSSLSKNMDVLCDNFHTKKFADSIIASSLMILVSLSSANDRNIGITLPFSFDELGLSYRYLPKYVSAMEGLKDIELVNLYI